MLTLTLMAATCTGISLIIPARLQGQGVCGQHCGLTQWDVPTKACLLHADAPSPLHNYIILSKWYKPYSSDANNISNLYP